MRNIIKVLIFSLGVVGCGGPSGGPSICDCKDNFWDPNNKKYGDLQVMENTGNLGGSNFTTRRNMVNLYNGMVPFDKLSESDKTLRKKCLDEYVSETEVMMSDCEN
jgi:hypothetical protein